MKKIIAILASVAVVITIVVCATSDSDEKKIVECIDNYVACYNAGDIDGCLECIDSRSRNALKGSLGLGSVATGKDWSSILFGAFSVSVFLDDVSIKMEVKKITFKSDRMAVVNVDFDYITSHSAQNYSDNVDLIMIKEGKDWFVKEA